MENDQEIRIRFSTLENHPGVYEAINNAITELGKAYEKHPSFPNFGYGQASIVMEEVGEWADAVKSGVWQAAYLEAAHVVAVMLRAMCAYDGVASESADFRMAKAMAALGDVARAINDNASDNARMFNNILAAQAVAEMETCYEN